MAISTSEKPNDFNSNTRTGCRQARDVVDMENIRRFTRLLKEHRFHVCNAPLCAITRNARLSLDRRLFWTGLAVRQP
ncbi:MAG: hypothetical protein WDN03_12620 [Rhizomicrobium sp.]